MMDDDTYHGLKLFSPELLTVALSGHTLSSYITLVIAINEVTPTGILLHKTAFNIINRPVEKTHITLCFYSLIP